MVLRVKAMKMALPYIVSLDMIRYNKVVLTNLHSKGITRLRMKALPIAYRYTEYGMYITENITNIRTKSAYRS